MRFGITAKLFLAILAATVAIAVAIGVAERLSFDRGFRDYMREREAERLTILAGTLAALWRERHDFESLRGDDEAWQRVLRGLRGTGLPAGPPRPDDARGRFGDGPPPGPPPDLGPGGGDPDAGRMPPPGERGRPPLPALLDARRQRIVGDVDAAAASILQPVTVDGRTVGWLAGAPLRAPFTGAEQRLAEQQAKTSVVIGALAVAVAALVAFLLARGFLAPVRRLAAATHRLAAGEYATRVEARGHDELAQLVGDFNRLAQTLERNESSRRHFMADVSHELRTPLAILRGELEAVEDGIRTLTPERLASLQAEVATLGKLVDDLYDLSLADVGALTYVKQTVDLVALVQSARAAFADRFAARRLAVEADLRDDPPVPVDGDARRLTQVLYNVLENCARYTDAGGRVRIAVSREGPWARVDIMDSGPGVAAEALPHLFDRLYRVEGSRNRESGGAGLGLALCRSIVEGHGGTCEALASPLGGVWIRVALPVARA